MMLARGSPRDCQHAPPPRRRVAPFVLGRETIGQGAHGVQEWCQFVGHPLDDRMVISIALATSARRAPSPRLTAARPRRVSRGEDVLEAARRSRHRRGPRAPQSLPCLGAAGFAELVPGRSQVGPDAFSSARSGAADATGTVGMVIRSGSLRRSRSRSKVRSHPSVGRGALGHSQAFANAAK